ncbi:MAG: GTPase HflX [Lachnospirales bacterium]
MLHETKEIEDKYILIYVSGSNNLRDEESFLELEELVKTSGNSVIGYLSQNLDKANPKTYFGKGKVEELYELIEETGADGIVADDELSAIQIKNLYNELKIKILDRTTIILDIFAQRATSSEGKLQIELARLQYRRAHLIGDGLAMSRMGGGSSNINRGSGETKLETDRRLINDRIHALQSELKTVVKQRNILRENHSKNKMPVVSMVGYTNAGKSTLLNALTSAGVLAEDKLFATLDAVSRRVELSNSSILFVDTVGFIQKLPHNLINAFKSTLEEVLYADILIHVVDASSPIRDEQMRTVYDTLKSLNCEKPIITVFNKCDKAVEYPLPNDVNAIKTLKISAKNNYNLDEFKNIIEEVIKSSKKYVEIILPYSEGTLLNIIHEKCEIEEEEYVENGIALKFFCHSKIYNKVEEYKI